eukprot:12365815-Alexandrium_andersonii.AAC.1
MLNRLRRSKLELCRLRKDLGICPRSSRGLRQMPTPPTKRAGGRAGGASRGVQGVRGGGAPPGRLMITTKI